MQNIFVTIKGAVRSLTRLDSIGCNMRHFAVLTFVCIVCGAIGIYVCQALQLESCVELQRGNCAEGTVLRVADSILDKVMRFSRL
jgi:hypothetical protein